MSTILIADDMPVIRSALGQVLRQQVAGVSDIWEAVNGEEAVELARAHRPDIVFMDIKMPGLTGLQATEQIRREDPHVRVVILTAYDEFAYVQKALTLGARDYLLKPVRPAKLVELVMEIQDEIDRERRDLRTVELVKDSLQRTLPVLETNLVENLIRGNAGAKSAVEETLSYLGRRLNWPLVLVAKLDDFERSVSRREASEAQSIYTRLVEQARSELPDPNRALVGYSSPGRIVAIVSTDQSLTTAAIRKLGERLAARIATETSFSVSVGFGKRYLDIDAIPFSYAEANLARRYARHMGGPAVMGIEDVEASGPTESGAALYVVEKERELARSVASNRRQEAQRLVNEIVDYLAQRYREVPGAMKNHCAELVTLAAWGVINTGVDEASILGVLHHQTRSLESKQTIPETRAWTLDSIMEIMTFVQSRSQRTDAVQDAITYIHRNYQRSDISLQEVAEAVNLSPSHLSSQFKARTKVNYVKYLTQLRLEEARRLLRMTDLSIAQVAENVGYPNIANFYRHFHREVGMTPAAYRQAQRG